ncbi:glucosaminidase domain-containing protein [Umezawaea tangerina]|uniref:Flagellum-specific peptidoglycan hydrolase FlgJ n=1 Tax=Umezawaea tangerina TaxID=84725 RepID=A0A2T0SPK4_9PSEU|nr:glucosaminidase domain-containing protein [Umezawaea tangerina]PRY35340.1 flagellum-specific peptidoglycan hydrolase FlgJ [Umezawaea tangerina]
MRILGPSPVGVTLATVKALLPALGATPRFVNEMAGPLWTAAEKYAVYPPGVLAQAFKETKGGAYGGQVKPEHCNTAGLKLRYPGLYPETSGDQPQAHAQFPSWEVGAEAHVQHLRAYTGCLVTGHLNVDPRWVFVVGKYRIETFEELGGKWAPSPSYGTELVAIANQLIGA